jgi:hypothetical protein
MCAKAESNIFQNFEKNDYFYVRKAIIDVILHTDMANHFTMVKNLQAFADKELTTENKLAFTNSGSLGSSFPSINVFNIESDSDRAVLSSMIVHASDLSNAAYPSFEVTKKWSYRVCKEFSAQVRSGPPLARAKRAA